MQTIAGLLRAEIPGALKQLNITESDVAMAQKLMDNIDPLSQRVIFGATFVGVSLIGRACCTPKLSQRIRWANLISGIFCLGAAGFELYANGKNHKVL